MYMYMAVQVVAIQYNIHANICTYVYDYSIYLHTEKILEETLIVFVRSYVASTTYIKHNLF